MLRPTLDDAITIGILYKEVFFPNAPKKQVSVKKRKGPHPRKGARRRRAGL